METRSSGELDLAAFSPVPRLPWSVMILEPAEAAFAPVNALTQRALLLIGITMLIAAVLGVLLARTITAPVQQLVKGAEEIGKGNLEYRIKVAARRDRQLARTFNQMTEDLQAITASRDELNKEITERKRAEEEIRQAERELEQRVVERTAQLERRNRELSVLYTISRAAAESLELEKTLNSAVEATLEALEIEIGGIYLLEPDGETLTLRVVRGVSDETARNLAGQIRRGHVRQGCRREEAAGPRCPGLSLRAIGALHRS